jgi:glycosyltransferase involved in cell wall biosynthesis
MRVALVHDWLTGMRGGEKALEVLADLFPAADIFTLFYRPSQISPAINRHKVHASVLNHMPGIERWYRYLLPLFPPTIETFNLDDCDLVVSTSHCAAKAVVSPGRARHVCYCFTPMRYAWDQFDHYFGPDRLGLAGSAAARRVLSRLARWDAATANRVSRYVAISHYVAGRISRYYNRRSDVVYPPVDTDFFTPDGRTPEDYALVVSALVPYKRLERAIDGARLAGMPLKVVGQGPDRGRLEAHARGSEVEFLGFQPDDVVRDLYRGAAAVVLPGEEDFGIVPVEAQACGRPVVALGRGGVNETVLDRVTGVLVRDDQPEAFADALRTVKTLRFDPAVARAHAETFGRQRFSSQMADLIENTCQAPQGARW